MKSFAPPPPPRHHTSNHKVVCPETYHSLFGSHGETDGGSEENIPVGDTENPASDGDGDGSGCGRTDAFLVPSPLRYVPDWAAFGSGRGAHLKNGQHDSIMSSQPSVTSGKSQKVMFAARLGCVASSRIPWIAHTAQRLVLS